MPDALLLLAAVGLPFVGAIAAGLLPTHARNAAAWLAGAVALVGLALVWAAYPTVAAGGVVRHASEWMPSLGLDFVPEDGRLRLALRRAGDGHRRPGGGLRALLHVGGRPGAALLRVPARLHGLHDRRGALRQPDPARLLLGADQPLLLPADRLLAPHGGRARRRAHGADRHRRRRAGAVRRRAGAGPHRRRLRPRPRAGLGRPHPVASALPAGAGPHPARRPDQERAVPVPLLAAARHGGADPGLGLPAFGDAGEGRRVPPGAAMAGAGGHRRLVLDRRHRPASPRCCSAPTSRSSSTT